MAQVLTPLEDADLRRLHALTRYAVCAPTLTGRLEELRGRDRREEIRAVEPTQLARRDWDDDTTD